MPIVEQMYKVIYEGKKPAGCGARPDAAVFKVRSFPKLTITQSL